MSSIPRPTPRGVAIVLRGLGFRKDRSGTWRVGRGRWLPGEDYPHRDRFGAVTWLCCFLAARTGKRAIDLLAQMSR